MKCQAQSPACEPLSAIVRPQASHGSLVAIPDVAVMTQLTHAQAYLAMYSFLDAHYQRTKSDDIGALLGSMSLLPDGITADPAVADEWQVAVQAALAGAVDAALKLTP